MRLTYSISVFNTKKQNNLSNDTNIPEPVKRGYGMAVVSLGGAPFFL